jgi:hypothetical protein
MPFISATVDVKRLTLILQQRAAQARQRAVRAMNSVAETWMTEAKQRCPVDTGALRSSGHVTEPDDKGDGVEIRLVFGGPAAPYAYVVHEGWHRVGRGPSPNTVVHMHFENGQAKYLESVAEEHGPKLAQEMQDFM